MKYSAFGIALAAPLVSSLPSSAAVNVRQINQERRIDAGHRSGKLTGSETRHLRGQQRSIARDESWMRARHGGHLTARDKRRVHAEQRRADRDILRSKQNRHRGENHLPF